MADAPPKSPLYVGVDLGGTKILAGVFTAQLRLVAKLKLSTKGERGPEAVLERVARCVRDTVDEADGDLRQVAALGLGAPGAVDSDEGRVLFAPNLAGWRDVPVKKILEKELGVPVFAENDGNAATLGVHQIELDGRPKHLVGLFLGTGVGGGLILDGRLHAGFNRTAGEVGHMVLDVDGPKCGCGNRGCFEALASRTAIFRRIQQAVREGERTVLTEMLGGELAGLRSGDLRKAIRKGDRLVDKIVEEAAEYAGVAVGNLINLLNPQHVVLGGGVIEALGDEMMAIIVETARDYAMPGTDRGVEIIASRLGDDAGIHGAAVLAKQRVKG